MALVMSESYYIVCVFSQYNAEWLQDVKIHEFLQFNEENWKNRELYNNYSMSPSWI